MGDDTANFTPNPCQPETTTPVLLIANTTQAHYTGESHAGFHRDQRQSPRYSSLEVFLLRDKEMAAEVDGVMFWLPPGWYWQFAEPGEAPDSNIYGPYATSSDAYNTAQDF
jgi:hypothetical protein